ncbi:MAG: DEAD/DEAH box helicase [Deltaproteobacteria bacterium]|nr:DEAD/DEAH box helicase [Deltaproteobacteria bacterium]
MASRELALKLLELAEPLVEQLVEHDPVARNAVYEALDSTVDYALPPTIDERWRLTASLRSPDGRTVLKPVIGVLPAGTPDIACSCANFGFCVHVATLLVDAAASEPLREALRKGTSTSAVLDTLLDARSTFRERFDRSRVLRNWLPPEARRVDGPFETSLAVEILDTAVAIAPECVFEFRVKTEGSRTLLDPDDLPTIRLPEPYDSALRQCQAMTRGRKGFTVRGTQASLVLQLLEGVPLQSESDSSPIHWGHRPLRLHIVKSRWSADELRRVASGARARDAALISAEEEQVDALEGRWRSDDRAIDLPLRECVMVRGPRSYLWQAGRNTLHSVSADVDLDTAIKLQRRPAVPLPFGDSKALYQTLRERTRNRSVTLPAPETFGLAARERPELLARFGGEPLALTVELEARYRLDFVRVTTAVPDAPPTWRDLDLEQAALRSLERAGLVFDAERKLFVADADAAAKFWAEGIASLRALREPMIELQVPASLEKAVTRKRLQTRVRVGMDGDWIRGSVRFDAGDTSVDLAKLRAALTSGARWVSLDDGSLAEITRDLEDAVRELEDITDASGCVEITRLSVGRMERLAALDPEAELDSSLRALRESIKTAPVQEGKVPVGLRAELRGYQKAGLGWLQFIKDLRAGGILADDMGLGKTITTLAMILWQRENEGTKPTLVVAPTSVITNWLREASRFAPDLRVVLLHGERRFERHALAQRADLVITSYGVLRSDVEVLSKIDWRIVALDEAQTIKNAGSSASEAARRLKADMRLALSGTPVENRLGELWSIMDFVNPGLLGTLRDFERRYELPITHDGDAMAAARLRAVVRPFVLRRTKREVLTELPAKEEIARVIELAPVQRKMYDAMSAILRDEIGREVKEKGVGKSSFHVLTALLRLRQMACDPRLVDPATDPSHSAKREAFLEIARNLVSEGRRALVFSGFRQLLELWRGDLDAEGIRYEYLDGTTTDRDARVHRFQTGDATLFLISLKAGGTGLNLTAADTVIHVDPWWNPAVEEQATDRAHRMGQTRSVTVYRLIAEGTVEEKITALKARKKDLADAVVREDAGALRGLSDADVRMLLGEIGEPSERPESAVYDDEASDPTPPDSAPPSAIAEPVAEPILEPVATAPMLELPSALASAFAAALAGEGPSSSHDEPPAVERPIAPVSATDSRHTERKSHPVDSVPTDSVAKPVAPAKGPTLSPTGTGEFVSGPLVDRAQAVLQKYLAKTESTTKELGPRLHWSASHLDQLLAGRKKYIPSSVAAAIIALEREA